MADDQLMNQGDIEQLLNADKGEATPAPPESPAPEQAAANSLGQGEIESLPGGGNQAAADTKQPQDAEAEHGPAQDDMLLGQQGVEQLLQQAGTALTKPTAQPTAPGQGASDFPVGEGDMLPGDVDFLLQQAEQALESVNTSAAGDLPEGVSSFRLDEFTGASASTESASFDLIRDVELDLRIELGRTHMYLEDVLKLRKGSVVPLDKLAGDPVDVYVNGRLIARGEVLVLSDNFCVRIAELTAGTHTFA
jgi:flagellar motor switch protein FliN/FliY